MPETSASDRRGRGASAIAPGARRRPASSRDIPCDRPCNRTDDGTAPVRTRSESFEQIRLRSDGVRCPGRGRASPWFPAAHPRARRGARPVLGGLLTLAPVRSSLPSTAPRRRRPRHCPRIADSRPSRSRGHNPPAPEMRRRSRRSGGSLDRFARVWTPQRAPQRADRLPPPPAATKKLSGLADCSSAPGPSVPSSCRATPAGDLIVRRPAASPAAPLPSPSPDEPAGAARADRRTAPRRSIDPPPGNSSVGPSFGDHRRCPLLGRAIRRGGHAETLQKRHSGAEVHDMFERRHCWRRISLAPRRARSPEKTKIGRRAAMYRRDIVDTP